MNFYGSFVLFIFLFFLFYFRNPFSCLIPFELGLDFYCCLCLFFPSYLLPCLISFITSLYFSCCLILFFVLFFLLNANPYLVTFIPWLYLNSGLVLPFSFDRIFRGHKRNFLSLTSPFVLGSMLLLLVLVGALWSQRSIQELFIRRRFGVVFEEFGLWRIPSGHIGSWIRRCRLELLLILIFRFGWPFLLILLYRRSIWCNISILIMLGTGSLLIIYCIFFWLRHFIFVNVWMCASIFIYFAVKFIACGGSLICFFHHMRFIWVVLETLIIFIYQVTVGLFFLIFGNLN